MAKKIYTTQEVFDYFLVTRHADYTREQVTTMPITLTPVTATNQ